MTGRSILKGSHAIMNMEGFSYHDKDTDMEREAWVTSSAMNSENRQSAYVWIYVTWIYIGTFLVYNNPPIILQFPKFLNFPIMLPFPFT